LTIDN